MNLMIVTKQFANDLFRLLLTHVRLREGRLSSDIMFYGSSHMACLL